MRPEYWKTLGEKGNFVSFIVYYHPTMKLTTRGEAFRKKYMEQFKEEPIYGALQRIRAGRRSWPTRINAAKSDKGEDLVKALLAGKFEGWNGTISFTRGEGPYWQQWTPPMLVTQYTKPEMPFADVEDRLSGRAQDGRLDGGAQALSPARRARWTRSCSPSTCCPGWSSA